MVNSGVSYTIKNEDGWWILTTNSHKKSKAVVRAFSGNLSWVVSMIPILETYKEKNAVKR